MPDLVAAVALLVAERDDLARRVAEADADSAALARVMYRRGYWAGHAAGRRGAPRVTNPERHARGELRKMVRPLIGAPSSEARDV